MRQSQSHALGGRKAVLAVEDHAMASIQQEHRRARTFVFGLTDHQVLMLQVQRNSQTFARDSMQQSRADVEIQCVAEFIFLSRLIRFDAGGKMRGLVPPKAAPAERAE